MKRLTFLAGLFGVGAFAGKTKPKADHSQPPYLTLPEEFTGRACMTNAAWCLDGKAQNNQCPVCGAMAPPWRPPNSTMCESQLEIGVCAMMLHLTMCTHCRAAFWQAAESAEEQ